MCAQIRSSSSAAVAGASRPGTYTSCSPPSPSTRSPSSASPTTSERSGCGRPGRSSRCASRWVGGASVSTSPSGGAKRTTMSAWRRCGRMNCSESASRRSSSASTSVVVYPRREQSRSTFHLRRKLSGGSRKTRMSKQSRIASVWYPSRPSTIRNRPGFEIDGRPEGAVGVPVDGLQDRLARPQEAHVLRHHVDVVALGMEWGDAHAPRAGHGRSGGSRRAADATPGRRPAPARARV